MSYSVIPNTDLFVNGQIKLPAIYPQWRTWYNSCEMNHKKFWLDTIKKEWVVLDIGANVGIFSCLFSKLAKHVYSFEPIKETLEKLRVNLQANGCTDNVTIVDKAVSDKQGEYIDEIHSQWGYKTENKQFSFITIDNWVNENNVKVDAMKIDVDGYDYEVLKGAIKTIQEQHPVIVVEIQASALDTRDYVPKDIHKFMEDLHYKGYYLDKHNCVYKFVS